MSVVRISVAIPIWNDSEWLAGAIESVLAQTYPHWELVIGDNASADDPATVVSRYDDPRIRCTSWSDHVGASENHNRTMALSRYEWVQVLGADDRLHPRCLERIAATIEEWGQRTRLAMVVTACQRVDARGEPADIDRLDRVSYRPVPHQPITGALYDPGRWLRVNAEPGLRPWMIGSVAVPRELIEAIGGFRPEMGLCHDLELFMRVAAYGDVAYIDEKLLNYTVRSGSLTAQLEHLHVKRGDAMVDVGAAWLAVLRVHESRRYVSCAERRAISSAIARAFLRRALLHRSHPEGQGRLGAVLDVQRATRTSPRTVLLSWRMAVALGAIVAPLWALEAARHVGHRLGMVIV